MSLLATRTKVKEMLDSKAGIGKVIHSVYDEHRADLAGFPSITFEPSDVESDFNTNTQNERRYVFRIAIHQEMEQLSRKGAVDKLCAVVDELTDMFENDWTLGGTVDYCRAVPLSFEVYQESTGLVMVAELKLDCIKIIDLTM